MKVLNVITLRQRVHVILMERQCALAVESHERCAVGANQPPATLKNFRPRGLWVRKVTHSPYSPVQQNARRFHVDFSCRKAI